MAMETSSLPGQKWCADLRQLMSLGMNDVDIDGILHEIQEQELISLFDALRKNRGLQTFSLRHV